jgi:hypothetical protein
LHATARAGMVCVRHVRVFAAAPPPQRTLKIENARAGPDTSTSGSRLVSRVR